MDKRKNKNRLYISWVFPLSVFILLSFFIAFSLITEYKPLILYTFILFAASTILLFFLYKGPLSGVKTTIKRRLVINRRKQKLQQKASIDYMDEKTAINEAVFQQSLIGMSIMKNYNITAKSNEAFLKMLGRNLNELSDITWPEITHPKDLKLEMRYFQRMTAGLIEQYEMEKRFLLPDGSFIWVNAKVSPLHYDHTSHSYYLLLIEDISKHKVVEKEQQEMEKIRSIMLENLPAMVYRCKPDLHWTMTFVSAGSKNLTGYYSDSLLYNKDISYAELILPKYRQYISDRISFSVKNKKKFSIEYEIATKEGGRKWVLEIGRAVYNKDGDIQFLEGIVIDISDRKKDESGIFNDFLGDIEVNINNQMRLLEDLQTDIYSKTSVNKALILIKVDDTNLGSQTAGYFYTETTMLDMIKNLMTLTSTNIKLYQLGSDRFILYAKGFSDSIQLGELSYKALEAAKDGLMQGSTLASCGIYVLKPDEVDIQEILNNVEMAADKAAKRSSFSYYFFDDLMYNMAQREKVIKSLLYRICSNNESDDLMYIEYQPIVDAKKKISSMEAFTRIQSPELGVIAPSEFIPIAEKNNMIALLGNLIFKKVCSFLSELMQQGITGVSVSLNISVKQILRPDFLPELLKIMKDFNIDSKLLILEISESTFSESVTFTQAQLSQVRNAGIQIAIENFGTGYPLIFTETWFPADIIKIDRFYIDSIMTEPQDKILVADVISIIKKSNCSAVAKQVEYNKQFEYLKNLGCDYFQGYLFYKALPRQEIQKLLASADE